MRWCLIDSDIVIEYAMASVNLVLLGRGGEEEMWRV